MKTATIILHTANIHDYVNVATFKRVDAAMDQSSQRAQDAVQADAEESNDGFLIDEFCDRRDAALRQRLQFCLVDKDPYDMTFDNTDNDNFDYVYKLCVDDSVTPSMIKSIGKKMDEYIKRGAVYSWYLNAGLEPTDSEASLKALEDDIAFALRGRPWGKRPMQPFGPAQYNFYKKDF